MVTAVSVDVRPPRPSYVASSVDVWALGVVTVICGQFFSWNVGLAAGTASFGYGVVLTGLAFLCLVSSLAEIASALPFDGGAFGLARCTLGFYVAFVVGCCEMVQYMLYSAMALVMSTRILSQQWPGVVGYEPLVWAGLQAVVFLVISRGGRPFWRTVFVLATLALVIVFFYCLCAMTNASLDTYSGGGDASIQGGLPLFFQALPHGIWLFSGVESLATLSTFVDEPCKAIPKGQLASMWTLLMSSCCIYLVAISFPPGAAALPGVFAVLSGGFSLSFDTVDAVSNLLSLPAIVGAIPGFSLAATNILSALGRANLVSTIVYRHGAPGNPPPTAIATVSIMNLALCFALDHVNGSVLYSLSMALGFMSYIVQCAGFISWRHRHNRVPRRFISPVGTKGAMFSTVVFALGLVSTLCCQSDSLNVLIATTGLVGVLTVYYHAYAKRREKFSTDEHLLLFFGHVDTSSTSRDKHASQWRRVRSQLRLFAGYARDPDKQQTKPTKFSAILPSLRTQRSEPRCTAVRVGGAFLS